MTKRSRQSDGGPSRSGGPAPPGSPRARRPSARGSARSRASPRARGSAGSSGRSRGAGARARCGRARRARCASSRGGRSASARSSVTTPSACPVVTGPLALESRSNFRPLAIVADRQAELEQLEDQPPLGRLGDREAAEPRLIRRAGAGERARARTARRAATPLQPISARFAHPRPRRRPSSAASQSKPELGAAVQALRVLEGDEVPADRAGEGAHRRPIMTAGIGLPHGACALTRPRGGARRSWPGLRPIAATTTARRAPGAACARWPPASRAFGKRCSSPPSCSARRTRSAATGRTSWGPADPLAPALSRRRP